MTANAAETELGRTQGPKRRWVAWGQLIGTFVALWVFAMVVGPYFETRNGVGHEWLNAENRKRP